MALVLRGARAAGVLKQVATAPLAQVRPRGSRGPRCRRHRRVRSRSRAQPVCSYDRVSVDARLTPRPTPTRTQANAARGFSVTTAGRAGMGSPVPAHEPPTGPVRTEVERRCAIASSLNRQPRDAKKNARLFFLGARSQTFSTRLRRRRRLRPTNASDDLRRSTRKERSLIKTRTRTSADRVSSPFRLFFRRHLSTRLATRLPFRHFTQKQVGGGERAQVGLRRRVPRAGAG